MKYVLAGTFILFALPLTFAEAQKSSHAETHIYTNSNSSGVVESRIETSGDAEVHVRTVINGEVVEDTHVKGDAVVSNGKKVEDTPTTKPEAKAEGESPEKASKDSSPESESLSERALFEELHIPDFLTASAEDSLSSLEESVKPRVWIKAFFTSIHTFIKKFF